MSETVQGMVTILEKISELNADDTEQIKASALTGILMGMIDVADVARNIDNISNRLEQIADTLDRIAQDQAEKAGPAVSGNNLQKLVLTIQDTIKTFASEIDDLKSKVSSQESIEDNNLVKE